MLLSLPVPLFFVLSISMSLLCVFALFFCFCLFFLFPPSLSFFFFFFFFACLSLFIERFPKNCSLFLSQLIRSWSSFCQFFSSTAPNFKFSHDPLFSLLLFSPFRYFLNSFFLVRDSPLSPNRVPHFLVMIFLYSLFSFSIILLLHLLLPVAIFNSLSLFIYLFRDNGRLTFWQPTFPYFFTLFS